MSDRQPGWPTSSQDLLLRAALVEGDAALAAWRRWKSVDTVTQTDQDSGRLFPLLCRKFVALAVEDPDLWILKSAYRHQWLSNQHRLAAAGRALDALAKAGIPTMVLKGAALGYRYYKDLGTRPMYDVDVLVRPQQARLATETLVNSGWTQLLPFELDMLLRVTHGTLFRDHVDTGLDLHWYAMWAPAVEDDFWSAAEPIEVGGAQTLALCPADQLLHVCVHGLWSEGHPIRWIADAITVIRSTAQLDWDRVVERARARAITLPLLQALTYVRDQFEVPVPTAVLGKLDRTPRGVLERAGHRAWRAPTAKLHTPWLALERYRRQRPLPAGPTREANLWRYLRCWTIVNMQLDAGERVAPALFRALLPRPT